MSIILPETAENFFRETMRGGRQLAAVRKELKPCFTTMKGCVSVRKGTKSFVSNVWSVLESQLR